MVNTLHGWAPKINISNTEAWFLEGVIFLGGKGFIIIPIIVEHNRTKHPKFVGKGFGHCICFQTFGLHIRHPPFLPP